MCTLTLHRSGGSLLVTMNRDERRSRAAEAGPRLHRCEATGVSWIAPLDGERGGTWIGANSRGMVACLLNGYDPADELRRAAGEPLASRGNIIPQVLAKPSIAEALRWLEQDFSPTACASFALVLADVRRALVIRSSGGPALAAEPLGGEWEMLSSSSWNAAEVLPWRQTLFADWLRNGAPFSGHLPAFHLEQPAGLEEWAPLVRRERTTTRSITQVAVGPQPEATLRYWADPSIYTSIPDVALMLALDDQ